MGYPKKLLNDTENIVLDLNPHWRIFLAPVALLVLALVGLTAVIVWIEPDQLIQLLSGIPAVLGLIWFIWRYILWRTTHFVLTSDRVIYRSGVISKQGQNIPLERINNVAFSQTVLERMLNVGDLRIESGNDNSAQTFEDVLNPSRVENRIYAEIEASQARDRAQMGGGGISTADELAKFSSLRAQGVISEAEFEAQKARLLGEGGSTV